MVSSALHDIRGRALTWCWLKCEEQEKEFPASASDEHEEEEKNACDEVDEMRDDDDNAIVEFR